MADLNERVQARLADFELIFALPTDADRVFRYVDATPAGFLRILIPSWRERWERHQPRKDTEESTLEGRYCPHCADDDGAIPVRRDWLCLDALCVLREIGIEP